MIKPLQSKASDNRTKHSDRLEDVWNGLAGTAPSHCWSEEVVYPVDVRDISNLEPFSRKAYHIWVKSEAPISRDRSEVNRFDSVACAPPAPLASLEVLELRGVTADSEVGGQHGDRMTSKREPRRNRPNFCWRTAGGEEGVIGLRDLQDLQGVRVAGQT